MLRVFVCYGGGEGERIGVDLRDYLNRKGIKAFLASPGSPDIPAGIADFNKFIDGKLLSSDLMVPICDSGIHSSRPALRELRLAKRKNIPVVAFVKKRCRLPIPIRKDWQPVRFDPNNRSRKYSDLLIEIYRRLDWERELSEDLSAQGPVDLPLGEDFEKWLRRT